MHIRSKCHHSSARTTQKAHTGKSCNHVLISGIIIFCGEGTPFNEQVVGGKCQRESGAVPLKTLHTYRQVDNVSKHRKLPSPKQPIQDGVMAAVLMQRGLIRLQRP